MVRSMVLCNGKFNESADPNISSPSSTSNHFYSSSCSSYVRAHTPTMFSLGSWIEIETGMCVFKSLVALFFAVVADLLYFQEYLALSGNARE